MSNQYHTITYEEFRDKILNEDFVFDGYLFSEDFYSKISTSKPDFLQFGQQIYSIFVTKARNLINTPIQITIKNCIFDFMMEFDFEQLPHVTFLRIRDSQFKNSCSFKNLKIDTKNRELGYEYSLNYCLFDNVSFKNLNFENVNFQTSHIFNNIEFTGVTTLYKCTFEEKIIDVNSVFKKDVLVIGSVFKEDCDLRCSFEKDLYVIEARESKINDKNEIIDKITPGQFNGKTYLRGEFNGGITFKGIKFNDNFVFKPSFLSQKIVTFEYLDFKEHAKFDDLVLNSNTYFKDIDLSKTSFLNSKFDDVLFSNCILKKEKIFDELQLEDSHNSISYKDVINELRMFEMSFDKRKNFEQAGKFHCSAMEIQKDNEESNFKKFILWCYKCSSNYGESYTKSLSWMGFIIALFSFLYLFSGLHYQKGLNDCVIYYLKCENTFNFFNDLGCCFLYSLISSAPIKKELEFLKPDNGFTVALSIVQTILQTILGTLFIIAVRRKFKR